MKTREISQLLSEMPGISIKTADRLTIALIENPTLINNLKDIVKYSEEIIKDEMTGLLITKGSVSNENKEKDILLVVESNNDVNNINNKLKSNKSMFILDLKNKRDFKNMEIILKRLFYIIKKYKTKEVLFLLAPSIESELTMRVIKEEITNQDFDFDPLLTRLSMGIPFGGSIEFSDERTIKEAMNKREKA